MAIHKEFILARNRAVASFCTKTFGQSSQLQRSQLQKHEEFILVRNPTVVPNVQSLWITHLNYKDLNYKGTKNLYWREILKLFPLYKVV
jgi:hypothetical protein